MRITYTFQTNPAYYRTVIDRYYQQLPFLLHLPVQFGILALFVLAFFAWDGRIIAGGLVSASVFLIGILATKSMLLLRFKHRADFGQEVVVTISDRGVEAKDQHVEGAWQWAAYPRSVRFPDGILLSRAGAIRWLPDSAIQEGVAELATSLVASKSILRRVA
jgi:hypothetical protein